MPAPAPTLRSASSARDNAPGRSPGRVRRVGCMRGVGGVLQLTQQSLHVCRKLRPPDDLRPELQRRGSSQLGQKAYDAEIVVEMRASATMLRVARYPDPGPALPSRAGAPEVLACRIGQENVCAAHSGADLVACAPKLRAAPDRPHHRW